MRIRLNGGLEVEVNSFSYGYTYGSIIEGVPNKKLNEAIIQNASYPSNWGDRKLLKVQPNKSDLENKLKPICYAVWLKSFEPINKRYDASELVVIWFGDHPDGKSIEYIIESGVKNIDWKKNAQDVYFF